MSHSEDLRRVAKRVVWFKQPEETLSETSLFLAHVMTYGTLEDIVTAMKYYSDADFDLVLKDPPAESSTFVLGTIGTCATTMNRFRHYHNVSFPRPKPLWPDQF